MTEPLTLVQRLRDQHHMTQGDGLGAMLTTANEAAARIEADAAANKALTAERDDWADQASRSEERRRCAEAKLAKVEAERDEARSEVARYWTSADIKPWCDLAEEKGLGHFGKKLKGMFSRAMRAEDEARREFDRAESLSAEPPARRPAMTHKPKSAHRDGWGILNRYGDMWTATVFGTKEQAEAYLRDFWRGNANAPDLTGYRIIWCRQRTAPIRKPEAKEARDGTD